MKTNVAMSKQFENFVEGFGCSCDSIGRQITPRAEQQFF